MTICIITLKYAYIPIIALSAFQIQPKDQMAIIKTAQGVTRAIFKKNLLSLCTIYTRLKYWLRAVLATKLISLQTYFQRLTSDVSVLTIYTHVRVRMHTRTLHFIIVGEQLKITLKLVADQSATSLFPLDDNQNQPAGHLCKFKIQFTTDRYYSDRSTSC